MCDMKDCPLCRIEDDRWDAVAPVVDHDDHELFVVAQLGHQSEGGK